MFLTPSTTGGLSWCRSALH